jgi:hypothetical protein
MIKLLILLLVGFVSFKPIQKSEIVEGTVIFYYSKKTPSKHIDPPDMYCLDSIRFYKGNSVYAVKGEYLQNEYFVYEPKFRLIKSTNVFRQLKLYCTNPMENHIHQGGEIYNSEDDSSKLFIAFNVEGNAYHIIPNANSIKNETKLISLSKSRDLFLEEEENEYCPYFVNYSDYYIFTDELKADSLSEFQRKEFRLTKSKMTKFWRYGQW